MFPLQAHRGPACILPQPRAFVPSCCCCCRIGCQERLTRAHRTEGASGSGFGFGGVPTHIGMTSYSYFYPVGCGKMFLHQVPSLDKALTTGSSPKPAMAMRITMAQHRSRVRRHGNLLTRLSPGGLEIRSGTCWTDCCGGATELLSP